MTAFLPNVVLTLITVPALAEQTTQVPDRRGEFAKKLSEPFKLDDAFEGVPFENALNLMSNQIGVPILIDPVWEHGPRGGDLELGLPPLMKADGDDRRFVLAAARADSNIRVRPVSMPKLESVRFRTALEMLTAQLDATFLLMPDHIMVTSVQRADFLTGRVDWKKQPPPDAVLTPEMGMKSEPATRRKLVHLDLKKVALPEALSTVADQSGANVLLDPRLSKTLTDELTLKLFNTPVNVAVETLADLHGFAVVDRGNVLLVTSPENAETIRSRRKLRNANPWQEWGQD